MKKFIILLSTLLLSVQVQAALVNATTTGDIIGAIALFEDSPTNLHQQGFNEKQGVTLAGNLAIDGGFIVAGTRVDSHLIFLNTPQREDGRNLYAEDGQTWGFDGMILGVMSKGNGSMLKDSNPFFAVNAVLPSLTFSAAGLETPTIGRITGTHDGYIINGLLLDLQMEVTEPGDWIRVITASAVPVPAAVFLFAPALLGFMGLRRKAKLAVK